MIKTVDAERQSDRLTRAVMNQILDEAQEVSSEIEKETENEPRFKKIKINKTTCVVEYETYQTDDCVNAPMQKFGGDNADEIGVLTVGEYRLIKAVLEHAQKYLDGDRRPEPKQLNLLDEEES